MNRTKRNVTIKPSHIKGLLLSPPSSTCLRDCFRPPHPAHLALPSVPSLFSRPTESLKGLHRPQRALRLQRPSASPDTLRSPAPGLLSCIGIQARLSLVSSPPLGLNCGEEWKRSGRRGKRKGTEEGRRDVMRRRKRRTPTRGGLLSCC